MKSFSINRNFARSINESKKVEKLTLVLLSTNENSTFSKMLREKCAGHGFDFIFADPTNCTLRRLDDDKFELNTNGNTYTLVRNNTVVMPRLTVLKNSQTKNALREFEYYDFFVVNNLESFENCEDKYTTYKVLCAESLATPKTTVVNGENMDRLQKKVDFIGGQFPIVCKLLNGKKGVGVFIIDSFMSLKSTLEAIFKLSPESEILMQNKIDSDYDLRIHVFNKSYNRISRNLDDYEVIGVMRRNKVTGDFRTNFSLGGTIEKFTLAPEQEELAKKTAMAVKCRWCGVDMIEDRATGENYIIEVNASPGVKGMSSVSEHLPLDYIFNYFKQFRAVNNNTTVIGKVETAKLTFENGEYEGDVCFDIQSDVNSIYASEVNYSERENTITFNFGGSMCVAKVIASMVDRDKRKCYLVNADVEFNDRRYRNSLFNVYEGDNEKVCMSSQFISLLGNCVSIDPQNDYLVTDKVIL